MNGGVRPESGPVVKPLTTFRSSFLLLLTSVSTGTYTYTVDSVITHTSLDMPRGMAYGRV